jgi:hypothetical protein
MTFQGTTATTCKDKAALIHQALFLAPAVSQVSDAADPTSHPLPWPKVPTDDIQNALKSSSSTMAPGPDCIGFECIKKAYTTIPKYFNTLFLVLFPAGYHPIWWRQATIIILKKVGKPDYSVPKGYSPISLLNCQGKISEKIIATRLAHLGERHHLLDSLQIGGRPKRSAVDAALFLATKIDQANIKHLITSTLCIDVKGAFDNIYKPRLLHTFQS